MIFKDAKRESLISDDPTEFVDTVRQNQKSEQRPFTITELKTVLSVADEEWRSMILFGLYTGQRLADIAALKWRQIDLQRNEIRIRTRKTEKLVLLPISPPLRKHLVGLSVGDDPDQPIHPVSHSTLMRENRAGTLSRRFGEPLADAGLREKRPHKRTTKEEEQDENGRSGRRQRHPLSFHSLRRTTTTLLHESGIPQAVAQQFVGHDSDEIHETYVSVGRQALEQAGAALPDLVSNP